MRITTSRGYGMKVGDRIRLGGGISKAFNRSFVVVSVDDYTMDLRTYRWYDHIVDWFWAAVNWVRRLRS